MPGRNPTRSNALLLVLLLFGQLLMMAGSIKRSAGTTLLETAVGRVSEPVVGVARDAGGVASGSLSYFGELKNARADNGRLKAEVDRLRTELDRYREQSEQNRRLRRLLGMREDLAPRSVGAEVVTSNLSGQACMIVIDRGADAGVHPDLPVVAWGGAVGRVVWADKRFAKVRLLTDPNSGAAGIVQRSRAEGMVLGHGDGPLEMSYVPKFADVALGDRIITSGLDGVFPRGFGIGRVTVVEDPSGVSKVIRLEPEVDFAALEEVLVLLEPVGGAVLTPPETGDAP